jgi:hypothetical protein
MQMTDFAPGMIVLGSFSGGAESQRSVEPMPIRSTPHSRAASLSSFDVNIIDPSLI